MILYAVGWTGYVCAGAMTVLGFRVPLASLPAALHPALAAAGACRAQARFETYDPARRRDAEARVRALGQAATFFRCDPWRCREIPVQWRTEAQFEE